ncbi:ABC-2 type transport system permease protein [Haloferula luteola]|uniref:ABC-2 type transport system permease protein n=1 Tax=Haloferula luteola TaxID=595692 RepID=A0A840VDS2_9BACT|nr:ABC transporter permease [Haloferula luteola]MBB5350991.1 ABC-2 type transport system permease protein [Haloferula luteola]
MKALSFRRLRALCWKETLQIFRDPSSNLIAFILPLAMMVIFGFGLNLDSSRLHLGLLNESPGTAAHGLAAAFVDSPSFDVEVFTDRNAMDQALTDSAIRGYVVIPADFDRLLVTAGNTAPLQVVADGSEPNTARFVDAYSNGIWNSWLVSYYEDRGLTLPEEVQVEPRYWFNPSTRSRNFLIPGSVTVIMTVVGALLTSLVVAREWERGTMEALLASPVTRSELLLSKIIPYYGLGMVSLLLCVSAARWMLGVPFRGSLPALLLVGSFFLLSVLGIGLLLSTVTRNQFNAAQAALNAAFLPATMLSGFIYEISSMPPLLRGITHLIPARYFVSSIQTLFLAGDLWNVLLPDLLFLMAASAFFLGLTARSTRRRMD